MYKSATTIVPKDSSDTFTLLSLMGASSTNLSIAENLLMKFNNVNKCSAGLTNVKNKTDVHLLLIQKGDYFISCDTIINGRLNIR